MAEQKQCFYCKKKTEEIKTVNFTVYGITDSIPLPTTVYYRTEDIPINFCDKCSNKHAYIALMSYLGSFIISTGVLKYYLEAWFPAILCSILVSLIIGYITLEILELPNSKHPEVKRLLDLNWRTSRPSKGTFYQKDDYIKGY